MSWKKAEKVSGPKNYISRTPRLEERTLSEVPCFNCGKLVSVMLPFYGCIFCSDCMKGGAYSSADFHPHITLE